MCELKENVTCMLCGNYLIDAVTLTECLHFFCRACLLKHLKKEHRCPKCFQDLGPDLKTAFRRDELLQRFVYKIVPSLLWRELHRRQKLIRRGVSVSPEFAVKTAEIARMARTVCRDDERISLVVEYVSVARLIAIHDINIIKTEPVTSIEDEKMTLRDDNIPSCSVFQRYFRCPAKTKIEHLRKLMELKLAMSESYTIYFIDSKLSNILDEELSLQDLIAMTSWNRRAPFRIVFTLARTALADEEDKPPVLDVEELTPQERSVGFNDAMAANASFTTSCEPGTTNEGSSLSGMAADNGAPKLDANNDGDNDDGSPAMKSMIPRLSITLSTNAMTGRTTPGAYHPIITAMQTAPNSATNGASCAKNKQTIAKKRRNTEDDTIKQTKQSKVARKSTATIIQMPTTPTNGANGNLHAEAPTTSSTTSINSPQTPLTHQTSATITPSDAKISENVALKHNPNKKPHNSKITKETQNRQDQSKELPELQQGHKQQNNRKNQSINNKTSTPSTPLNSMRTTNNNAGGGLFAIPPSSLHLMRYNAFGQISPSSIAAAAAASGFASQLTSCNGMPSFTGGIFPPTTSPTSTSASVFSSLSPQQQQQQQLAAYYWETMSALFANNNGSTAGTSNMSPQQMAAAAAAAQMGLPMYNPAAAAAAVSNPFFALYKNALASGSSPTNGGMPSTNSEKRTAPQPSSSSETPKAPSPKKSRKDGPVQRLSADGIPIPKSQPSNESPLNGAMSNLESSQQQQPSQSLTVKQQEDDANEFIDVQSMDSLDDVNETQRRVPEPTEIFSAPPGGKKSIEQSSNGKVQKQQFLQLPKQQKQQQQGAVPRPQQQPRERQPQQVASIRPAATPVSNSFGLDAARILSTMVGSAAATSSLLNSAANSVKTSATAASKPTLAN